MALSARRGAPRFMERGEGRNEAARGLAGLCEGPQRGGPERPEPPERRRAEAATLERRCEASAVFRASRVPYLSVSDCSATVICLLGFL